MHIEQERILVVKQRDSYFKVSTVWTNEELERNGVFEVISEHTTTDEALTEAKRLTELNK